MIVDVPFRLTRRDQPAAADALLLVADGFGPLAAAIARWGTCPPAGVFAVAGGFMIVPGAESARSTTGAVPLRRLGGDLYVPADADLLPVLLSDEMADLTRDRGLIILPSCTVLTFDPDRPLRVADWLTAGNCRRGAWVPFPPRPGEVDRLTRIERPSPPVASDDLLAGRPDGADPLPGAGEGGPTGTRPLPEDVRPPSGTTPDRVAAGILMGLGKAFVWLAKALRSPGLARAGGALARKAIDRAPRISESVLGAQEAALREILRQLQSGDVERALRRAPIAVADPDAPSRVATGADLGHRDPRFRLDDLLGTDGQATGWLGGGNVWDSLGSEYRRLAAEAARRGDARRAAYLYGVLLRDPRAAANALMAGGLFRDAAILLRDRLQDEAASAAAFERAGDFDEALRLYDKLGSFVSAAALLRRLGDEDRAVVYYVRAADEHARHGRWLAAGDLIRKNTGQTDLSARYYRDGWDARGAEEIGCGERLFDGHLVAAEWDGIDQLVMDAADRLSPPRTADAGRFFNHALTYGRDILPEDAREELTDRIRLLFADHLRAVPRPLAHADDLFGRAGHWSGPTTRDAVYAAKAESRRSAHRVAEVSPPVRLANGLVTAVAVARDSGDIVVGTTTAVVCWRSETGAVVPVVRAVGGGATALSVDPGGRTVYVLQSDGGRHTLRCFALDSGGKFELMGQTNLAPAAASKAGWYLQASASITGLEPSVTLAASGNRTEYAGVYFAPGPPARWPATGVIPYLLASDEYGGAWEWSGLAVRFWTGRVDGRAPMAWVNTWSPGAPDWSLPGSQCVDWFCPEAGVIEIAGPDHTGVLHWSSFDGRQDKSNPLFKSATHPDGYVAACLTGPGHTVALTRRNGLVGLEVSGGTLKSTAMLTVPVPARAVAISYRRHDDSIAIVFDDGSAVRMPRP